MQAYKYSAHIYTHILTYLYNIHAFIQRHIHKYIIVYITFCKTPTCSSSVGIVDHGLLFEGGGVIIHASYSIY